MGASLMLLALIARASQRITRLPHLFGAVAQETLLIYFVHLCIVYGSVVEPRARPDLRADARAGTDGAVRRAAARGDVRVGTVLELVEAHATAPRAMDRRSPLGVVLLSMINHASLEL